MTGRELARRVRPGLEDREVDSWISGILKGTSGLHWKYFDEVCEALGLSPSELVRHDDTQLRELTPREMRVLRYYQEWPPDMQDRWLAMLDFFSGSIPDKNTAMLLDRVRALPRAMRQPVLGWLFRLLEEGIPPEALTYGVDLSGDESPTALTTSRPGPRPRRRPAAMKPKPVPPTQGK